MVKGAMPRRLASPLLALCLAAGPAAAHEERGASRRLFNWAATQGYIWGRCDNWTAQTTGCDLTQGFQCNHQLSEGPADGDIEVTLGGLPASTASQDVHLQWWATKQSRNPYEPLDSPLGGSVYWWMHDAYPLHNESDFNGGNVRVDENGQATIKVRQPSTYRVSQWIAFPHVHMRVCTGDAYAHATPDTLYFHWHGPIVLLGSSSEFNTTVVGSRKLFNVTSTTTTTTTSTTLARLTGSLRFSALGVTESHVVAAARAAIQSALGAASVSAEVKEADPGDRRLRDGQGEWFVVYVATFPAEGLRDAFNANLAIRTDDGAFEAQLLAELVAAGGDEDLLSSSFELVQFEQLEWVTTSTTTTATSTTGDETMTTTSTTTTPEETTSTTSTTTTPAATTTTTLAATATTTSTTTTAPATTTTTTTTVSTTTVTTTPKTTTARATSTSTTSTTTLQTTSTVSIALVTESSTVMGRVSTTSTPSDGIVQTVDLRISHALDILDLDALEFSPVYHCLLEGRFFDYFSSGCSQECPSDADAHIGQCVRQNVSDVHVSLEASWSLQVRCGEHCMHDKIGGTLHHVRIAVADHMNIPFQEVGVHLSYLPVTGRRLQAQVPLTTMYLTVTVHSRRISQQAGADMLVDFLPDATGTAWLLGLSVESWERVADVPPAESGVEVSADNATDDYAGAYQEIGSSSAAEEPYRGSSGVLIPGSSEYLPTEAAMGTACGILLLGTAFLVYVWRRRRMARMARYPVLEEVAGKEVHSVEDTFQEPRKPTQFAPSNAAIPDAPPAADAEHVCL